MKESELTVEGVSKQLADLEADYRARKRKLRALLAVLETEPKSKGDENT